MPGPLGGKVSLVRAARSAILCTAIMLGTPRAGHGQDHLNCKSWVQLNSADRVAAAESGTEAARDSVRPIVDALPKEHQAPFLNALRKCLPDAQPTIVDNLDSLCAREPLAGAYVEPDTYDQSYGVSAFRSVIDTAARQCTREVSALLVK